MLPFPYGMYLFLFHVLYLPVSAPLHLLLSLSPWNAHVSLFALSGMSGTQLCSHGEEGEERRWRRGTRRTRGDCYSKSPAQSPRKPRVRKEENVTEKGRRDWEREP